MALYAYVNGKIIPEEEAKVSVFDHGLLYGDGVFEGLRVYNGRIFQLERHLDRLYESAKSISLEVPLTKEEFAKSIIELCRKNELSEGYIRPVVTRGVGPFSLDPEGCKEPTVIILAREFPPLYGEKYEKGLKIITSTWRRVPPQSISPSIKSLNYLNNILARIEAIQRGADEALFLDIHGFVSEATADNIFIVRGGEVFSPPTSTNLKGVTRDVVFRLCKELGYQVKEYFFSLHDVYTADEVFMTGTAAEIAPIVEVDGRTIADGKPGKITRTLMEEYRKLTLSTGTPIFE